MNVSAKVDVVMAPIIPEPEPVKRVVILAPTKQRGTDEAHALGIDPVAIVTPRSPHSARGVIADQIVETDGLTPEERDALMVEVAPCLATSHAH